MKTHQAGQPAGSGMYVSFRDWDLQIVSTDGETLQGDTGHAYQRVPLLMLVVLSPLIGGLYAMAFPVVIFAAFFDVIRRQVSAFKVRHGGELVDWGIYVGVNRLCVCYVSAPNEALEGEAETRYLRVPTWMVLVGSPIIGGLYVLLFPVIMAGALVAVLVSLAVTPFARASERWGQLAGSQWQPSAAYLDRAPQPKAEDEVESSDTPDPLADLAEEVKTRRAEEQADHDGRTS